MSRFFFITVNVLKPYIKYSDCLAHPTCNSHLAHFFEYDDAHYVLCQPSSTVSGLFHLQIHVTLIHYTQLPTSKSHHQSAGADTEGVEMIFTIYFVKPIAIPSALFYAVSI